MANEKDDIAVEHETLESFILDAMATLIQRRPDDGLAFLVGCLTEVADLVPNPHREIKQTLKIRN